MIDDLEVQRVVETFRNSERERERLQGEVDRLERALELQRMEAERLGAALAGALAEKDWYMVAHATLSNELTIVRNLIEDAQKRAVDAGFTRLPASDDDALRRIAYSGNRNG